MKVNEHLLLDFLSTLKGFTVGNAIEADYEEKVNCVSTIVQTIERICSISPDDYSAKYFCQDCGWIGDDPEKKDRKEVYLPSNYEENADIIFSCPRCKSFKIGLRGCF